MKKEIFTNNWLIDGISDKKLLAEKELAIIGAKINLKRIDLGMDQKEFAKFMGVSQGLVSRWESGSYNFTISTLVSICQKLDLNFEIDIRKPIVYKEMVISIINNKLSDEKWTSWEYGKVCPFAGGVA